MLIELMENDDMQEQMGNIKWKNKNCKRKIF